MKTYSLSGLIVLICSSFYSHSSRADFGDIDLIVREGVENYFREQQRDVDLSTLEYEGEPVLTDRTLEVRTSVKAVQGITFRWDWHTCTTQIEVKGPGFYEDLGTECIYIVNH